MTDNQVKIMAEGLVPSMQYRGIEIQRIVKELRQNPWLRDVPESVKVKISFTIKGLTHTISGIIQEEEMEKIIMQSLISEKEKQ